MLIASCHNIPVYSVLAENKDSWSSLTSLFCITEVGLLLSSRSVVNCKYEQWD